MRGTVTAAAGGAPLAATLHIKPATGSAYVPFPADRPFGFFSRPLVPGLTYTLVAEMAGYVTQELNFTVPAAGGIVRNFSLVKA